jgi:transketolase
MRKTALDQVYELAKTDPRIFFVGSDLGYQTLKQFKNEMPDRFFMEGVSEANLIGISAGLALEGKIVYANTIATFLSRRCFEQIVLDMALHHVNVRLIANGGGLVYAPLGPTHLAIDDLAILRAVPHMTIVAPCDAEEMKRLIPLTVDHQGPMYIRLAKGGDPIVSTDRVPFKIGKAMPIREGRDALIVTTGVTLGPALKAAEILVKEGIEAAVLHMPTVKPLDRETLLDYVRQTSVIVTIEEHSIIGGLGSAVAEVILEANFDAVKNFKRIGIPDVFSSSYGSQDDLMRKYGITTENLCMVIRNLRDSKIKITV